jgi:hypothetical protein
MVYQQRSILTGPIFLLLVMFTMLSMTPLARADVWMPAASMSSGRYGHTATLLSDGRVLVTGGDTGKGNIVATSEIYNAALNIWSSGPSMSIPRDGHTATRLLDNRVLIVGGYNYSVSGIEASAEIYNPATNSW